MPLSLRLNTLLELCRPGLPLWDLCCDHGYLGEAAWHSGRFPEVIFNDAVDDLLERLKPRLTDPACRIVGGLAEEISEPLRGNIVIAGIGGQKTYRILQTHAQAGRLHAERLILCPEKDASWLVQQELTDYQLSTSFAIAHNHGQRWVYQYDRITR